MRRDGVGGGPRFGGWGAVRVRAGAWRVRSGARGAVPGGGAGGGAGARDDAGGGVSGGPAAGAGAGVAGDQGDGAGADLPGEQGADLGADPPRGGSGVSLGVEDVTVEVAGRRIVEDLRLAVDGGAFVGLVGPNGSGKSTLLRCVYRALRPASGVVRIGGADAHALPAREAARLLAALPQDSASEFDFTVAEVVGMGRLPHRERTAAGDREICAEAMARTGVGHLADRGFLGLSGGERQRVLIARALAQQPRVLVLDEPTNHLDIAHQLDVLSLVRGSGLTVLAALHDLNLAAAYCDALYVVDGGRVVASGAPHDVLRPELLAGVFGVRAHPVRHPETGAVQLLFDRLPRPDDAFDRHPPTHT